jgi:CheY-like chemotaxis protein
MQSRYVAMLEEAEKELSKLFRKSRKVHLSGKDGTIVLLDDIPEQKGVVEALFSALKIDVEIVIFPNAKEAERYIVENEDNIKLVIIDIILPGGINGIEFIEWLSEYNKEMPYVVVTGSEEIVEEIKIKFPGSDILVKGRTGINEFADAIGLPEVKSFCAYDKIPIDSSLK